MEEGLECLGRPAYTGNPGRPVVTGNPGGPYTIEFTGDREGGAGENGNAPVELLTVDTSGLNGGSASVTNKVTGEREGLMLVSATNVGGTTNGSKITIQDTLPKGLTATKIEGDDVYYGGYRRRGESTAQMECTKKPETEPLVCTIAKHPTETSEIPIEILTGDTLTVTIHVKASSAESSDEVNEVRVSGGGAEPVSTSTPVVISATPAEYGPAPGTVFAALSSNQAGAHASLTTGWTLNTNEVGHVAGPAKDVRFDLPPGYVGNATQLKKCSMADVLGQLEGRSCPADSMVGMATLYTGLVKDRVPEVLTTPVYAIQPAAGEPVAFAFDALLLPVRLDTALLSNGNYGVRVTAPSLSEAAEVFSTYITIWGVPADHSGPPANPELPQYRPSMFNAIGGPEPGVQRLPFLTNAQQCGTSAPVIMSTDSWTDPAAVSSRKPRYLAPPFQLQTTILPPLVGCEALTLQPSFTMLPDTLEAGAPAGYTLELNVPRTANRTRRLHPRSRISGWRCRSGRSSRRRWPGV